MVVILYSRKLASGAGSGQLAPATNGTERRVDPLQLRIGCQAGERAGEVVVPCARDELSEKRTAAARAMFDKHEAEQRARPSSRPPKGREAW